MVGIVYQVYIVRAQSQAHGAWISFPPSPFYLLPPFFQNFHINHSFFKIFIIIRFSSFDNISRRHTSWIIRVFCFQSALSYPVSVEKLWKQNTRFIHDVWRLLILSNEEKRMIMKILKKEWFIWKFWKKGGSREKRGGGNEIHAPCACGRNPEYVHNSNGDAKSEFLFGFFPYKNRTHYKISNKTFWR